MTTSFPDPRFIDANGVRLAVHEAGDGPAVVLVHGWPEIAYSWKDQMAALAAAGYRAIAPDLKGFGASDAPRDKALYDIAGMTGDLLALLDALGVEKAVFCGHDWGGAIIWPMAQLHPDRVQGAIGICTPHHAPPPAPPLDIIRKRFGPNHYFIRFQEEGAAEALFTGEEERFVRFMFRKPVPRAVWPRLVPQVFDVMTRFSDNRPVDPASLVLGDADVAVYAAAFRRSGFHGGINLYRNIDRNYHLMKNVDPTIRAPSLHVGAALDLFLPPEAADGMEAIVPDLERRILSDCGHWVMREQPDALNAILIDWLNRRIRG